MKAYNNIKSDKNVAADNIESGKNIKANNNIESYNNIQTYNSNVEPYNNIQPNIKVYNNVKSDKSIEENNNIKQPDIKAYFMRAGFNGELYKGYADVIPADRSAWEKYVGDETEELRISDNISIIMAKDAVIMGKTLNRAVYDENGSLRAILAGNLMAVRRNGKNYESICDEDITAIEQVAKPIERIYAGRIILKKSDILKEFVKVTFKDFS